MNDDLYKGYRSPMRDVMEREGVTVWCEVRAVTERGVFEGLILPRSETSDPEHLVLKLPTGYNIGLRHDRIERSRRSASARRTTRSPSRSSRSTPRSRT